MGRGTSLDEPATADHAPDLVAAQHEIDEYLDAHRVYDAFDFLLKELITNQPADPLQHLLDCLQAKDATGPLKLFVSGPPGLGKSCLARRLAETFGVEHISAGALLSQAGVDTSSGQLADDDETASLVVAKVKEVTNRQKGFVLDGFPRTRQQATYFKEEAVVPTHVLLLQASAEYIHERSRQMMAGEIEGVASKPETLDVKLQVFSGRTSDALEAYKGRLTTIPAEMDSDSVLIEMARIARKLPVSRAPLSPPRVLLLGPHGAGITTQAVQLALRLGAVVVDARDLQLTRFDVPEEREKPKSTSWKAGLLRKMTTRMDLPNVERLQAKDPLGIVGVRLRQPDCKAQGFVLTNFPTTEEEAMALEKETWLRPTRVVSLEASEEVCVRRLTTIRGDPVTGLLWTSEPENENVRKRLVADPRNAPEAVCESHEHYLEAKEDILEVFSSGGRCLSLDTDAPPAEVFSELADFVERPLPLPEP